MLWSRKSRCPITRHRGNSKGWKRTSRVWLKCKKQFIFFVVNCNQDLNMLSFKRNISLLQIELTRSQSIEMTHNWAQFSCSIPYQAVQAHLKNIHCLSQKGVKCSEIARGHFQKSQKLLMEAHGAHGGTEFSTDKSQC